MNAPIAIRTATPADVGALRALHAASLRRLATPFYGAPVVEAFIATGTVPEELIADGTLFVATQGDTLLGCAGWTTRLPGYAALGGKVAPGATVRSVYVHPGHARQGLGRRLMDWVEGEMLCAGHRQATLLAMLSGVPLYRRLGWHDGEAVTVRLPGGLPVGALHMAKILAAGQAPLAIAA
ncbi:GNAT family N-acetyltransferase [Falsiroseomonas sp. HW251]|uniref:GNAT family N-acetyltransferase n=1 Tax=Falsiroseomonas sp. HW251 TaxID=3390998 RepID=UPI003D311664